MGNISVVRKLEMEHQGIQIIVYAETEEMLKKAEEIIKKDKSQPHSLIYTLCELLGASASLCNDQVEVKIW